jgi:methylated-DNA-[protein]-cysteine S-methyltransferase
MPNGLPFRPPPIEAPCRLAVETQFGLLTLEAGEEALVGLTWRRLLRPDRPNRLLERAAAQLAAYFAGTLKEFDLPLAPRGSAHERAVWAELCRIPYGQTITYGELARRTGTVARAVGGTCGANPIAIVIPCHRVTAAGGALGGYSGGDGRDSKRRLLAHEAKHGGVFALTA